MPSITQVQWDEISKERQEAFNAVAGIIDTLPAVQDLVKFLGADIGNFFENPDADGYIAVVGGKTYKGELIDCFWEGTKVKLS